MFAGFPSFEMQSAGHAVKSLSAEASGGVLPCETCSCRPVMLWPGEAAEQHVAHTLRE